MRNHPRPTTCLVLMMVLAGFLYVVCLGTNLCRGIEAWTPVPASAIPYMSGFLAGALFRSTKGPKSMAIAGTLVMGVAAAWQGIKRHI